MTESADKYPVGLYEKGDRVRVANSKAAAVDLVFQGYKLKSEDISEGLQADEDEQNDESTVATRDDFPNYLNDL